MTSRDRLLSVGTIAAVLHDVVCAPGVEPDAEHRRVDRVRAVQVFDRLVDAGLINRPVTISDDFLAAS